MCGITQSASPAGNDAWHPINWLGANSLFMGDRKQAPSAPSQAAITRPNISANSDDFAESLNIRGISSSKSGVPAISANEDVAEYQRSGVARQRNRAAEKHTFVNAEQNQKKTPQTGVLVTAALEQLLVCVSGRVGVGVGVGVSVGECV